LVAETGFGLGDLDLVTREDQVCPAAMDVDRTPEVMRAHPGAFAMPAGTTFAPWALPGRSSGLGCLPEREVERVFFFLARRDAGADEQVIDVPVRQLAVPGERPYPEVHVALGLVGVALVNQTLDHLDDLG